MSDYGRPNMTCDDFWSVVEPVSADERGRLIRRFKRYYNEHRQLFTDFLSGKFADEDTFWDAVLDARQKAKTADEKRQTRAGLASTNERKFLKLAARILYLRMTSGAGEDENGNSYGPEPLPGDTPIPAHHVSKRIAAKLAPWFKSETAGYHAIRRKYRDAAGKVRGYLVFQSEP